MGRCNMSTKLKTHFIDLTISEHDLFVVIRNRLINMWNYNNVAALNICAVHLPNVPPPHVSEILFPAIKNLPVESKLAMYAQLKRESKER